MYEFRKNIAMRRSFTGAGFKECGVVHLCKGYGDEGIRIAYKMLL